MNPCLIAIKAELQIPVLFLEPHYLLTRRLERLLYFLLNFEFFRLELKSLEHHVVDPSQSMSRSKTGCLIE